MRCLSAPRRTGFGSLAQGRSRLGFWVLLPASEPTLTSSEDPGEGGNQAVGQVTALQDEGYSKGSSIF